MPDDLDGSVREQAIEKLKNSNSEISVLFCPYQSITQ